MLKLFGWKFWVNSLSGWKLKNTEFQKAKQFLHEYDTIKPPLPKWSPRKKQQARLKSEKVSCIKRYLGCNNLWNNQWVYFSLFYICRPLIFFFALSLAKMHHVIRNRMTGVRLYTPSDLISVFRFCPPFVNKTNILKIENFNGKSR